MLTRAAAAVYLSRWDDWQPSDLARTAGAEDPQQVFDQLMASDVIEQITLSPTRTLRMHRQQVENMREQVIAALAKMFAP